MGRRHVIGGPSVSLESGESGDHRLEAREELAGSGEGVRDSADHLVDARAEAAGEPKLARRRIHDVRTSLSLIAFGITDFAMINLKDFDSFGFKNVWNPLAE